MHLLRIICVTIASLSKLTLAAPVGIFLHSYSPEAPPEKIECFEFEKATHDDQGTWLELANGRQVLFTKYRNRGIVPYVDDLTPEQPDFDKYLKYYEDTATKIASTRKFLNPRILAMRDIKASATKRNEELAKLPTIRTADGKELRGCQMTKIENGTITVRYKDGFKTIDVEELDDSEKRSLNKTTESWSLDVPSISPKDARGMFPKIVLKNGAVLKNVKFKEFTEGQLVFTDGSKIYQVFPDQLPENRTSLGNELLELIEPKKIPAVAARPQVSSEDKKITKKTDVPEKPNEPELPEEQMKLGFAYAEGKGVDKDSTKAIYWWKKAADQDYVKAQIVLGLAYAQGKFVPMNAVESAKWYQAAAEQGDALGQGVIGTCYAQGNGVAKDEEKAVYWWTKAAKQGEAEAQCFLAISYDKGIGVEMDQERAVEWLQKAAMSGVAVAQTELGAHYAVGAGIAKDEVKAATWYRKAAEQGYSVAQVSLGLAYAEGNGVVKDEVEAVEWYRKAADQNDANGQFFLGLSYAEGKGVLKNEVEAFQWLEKAALQGIAEAQAMIGSFYAEGKGVAKNQEESAKWVKMAADQGYVAPPKKQNDAKNNDRVIQLIIAVIAILSLIIFFAAKKKKKTIAVSRSKRTSYNQAPHSAFSELSIDPNAATSKYPHSLIKFSCSNCGAKISASQEDVGLSANCPTCGQQLIVPESSEEQSPSLHSDSGNLPPIPKGAVAGQNSATGFPKSIISGTKKVIVLAVVLIGVFVFLKKSKPGNESQNATAVSEKEKIAPNYYEAYKFGYDDPERGDMMNYFLRSGQYSSIEEKAIAELAIEGAEDRRRGKPLRYSSY